MLNNLFIYVTISFVYLQEDGNSLSRYMKWADAVMVVYSITDRTSFDKARDCLCRVSEHLRTINKDCPLTLVANKIDLERYRYVLRGNAAVKGNRFYHLSFYFITFNINKEDS